MANSVISRKEYWIFAVLFLLAVFDHTSACRSRRGHLFSTCDNSYRNRHYGKRSINSNEQQIKNYYGHDEASMKAATACGESVCVSARHYPYERIIDAVNQVRRILASHNPYLERQKKRMDPEVLNYHSKPRYQSTNTDLSAIADGCKFRANITHLQEGYSSDDERTYYIVNIPSLQQRVHMAECIPGPGSCFSNDIDSPTSGYSSSSTTCRQAYRNESLLVLPSESGRFDVGDFRIRNFRVPNGCTCAVESSHVTVVCYHRSRIEYP